VRLCGASVSGNRPSGQGRMAGGPGRGREGRPGHPRWILRGSERNRGSRRGICADGARRAVRGRGRAGGGKGREGRGAPGERTVSRGGEAREADMRGEGSWSGEGVPGKAMLGAESVALSFAPRLLPPPACPSLPRPLSLLSALARSARPIPSPCPSRSSPSSFPFLCFHGSASLSPGLLFAGPGFRAAIPGENLVRPGFSAWRNPALAVSDPGASRCSIGLSDWPRGIRTAPGDGSRRDPGARRRRGGLMAE
jgi:hypothetical protein